MRACQHGLSRRIIWGMHALLDRKRQSVAAYWRFGTGRVPAAGRCVSEARQFGIHNRGLVPSEFLRYVDQIDTFIRDNSRNDDKRDYPEESIKHDCPQKSTNCGPTPRRLSL